MILFFANGNFFRNKINFPNLFDSNEENFKKSVDGLT